MEGWWWLPLLHDTVIDFICCRTSLLFLELFLGFLQLSLQGFEFLHLRGNRLLPSTVNSQGQDHRRLLQHVLSFHGLDQAIEVFVHGESIIEIGRKSSRDRAGSKQSVKITTLD